MRHKVRCARAQGADSLGYLTLPVAICCCSACRLLARKGGTPHSISYIRMLRAGRNRHVRYRYVSGVLQCLDV